MNADSMKGCSLIAAFHQMTTAREASAQHFENDPIFGRVVKPARRDAIDDNLTKRVALRIRRRFKPAD